MSDAAATLERPAGPAIGNNPLATIAAPDVGCPKCGSLESWGRSSWCPQCGFYPRLGTTINPSEDVPAAAPVEEHAAPNGIVQLWLQSPAWMKVLCLGVLAIFGESLAIRVVTPDKSVFRSVWASIQLLVGLGLFGTFHLIATFKATFKVNGYSFMDGIVHPFDIWRPTIQELPGSARRVWLATWGLLAAVCATGIIGGIRYSVLVEDWGFRQRAKSDIAAQIKAKAMEEAMAGAKQADSLEDAVKNAATAEGSAQKSDSELEMLSSDCVVVGYNVNPADGTVSELLLASVVDGELKYVGAVHKGIPDEVRAELATRLPELKRQTPFVKCPGSGVWVRPIVACKTKFKSWTDDKLISDAEFQELLSDIKGG